MHFEAICKGTNQIMFIYQRSVSLNCIS